MDMEVGTLLSSLAYESNALLFDGDSEPDFLSSTPFIPLDDMNSALSSSDDAAVSPMHHSGADRDLVSADSDDDHVARKRMRSDSSEATQHMVAPVPPSPTDKKLVVKGGAMVPAARVNQFLHSLSSEEKSLLEAEGVTLPKEGPITKSEERELKRLRRKIKNKISAQDSRRRRKEYMSQLELENEELKGQIKQLQLDNKTLSRHMGAVGEALGRRVGLPSGAGSGSGSSRACMVMMMLLAFTSQATVPCAAANGIAVSAPLPSSTTTTSSVGVGVAVGCGAAASAATTATISASVVPTAPASIAQPSLPAAAAAAATSTITSATIPAAVLGSTVNATATGAVAASGGGGAGRSECIMLDGAQSVLVADMLSKSGLFPRASLASASLDCVMLRHNLSSEPMVHPAIKSEPGLSQ